MGGQRGVVYQTDGIQPTQSATQYKDAMKILEIVGAEKQSTSHSATDRQLKSQMQLQADMMQEYVSTKTNVAESVKLLGCLDSGTGKHQSNQVISYDGLMTCEYAGQHKNPQRFIDIKEVDNE